VWFNKVIPKIKSVQLSCSTVNGMHKTDTKLQFLSMTYQGLKFYQLSCYEIQQVQLQTASSCCNKKERATHKKITEQMFSDMKNGKA